GLVSPDTFIVDKVSGKVLEKKTGTKESSIWLSPNGGTTEDTSKRGDTLSLTDEDLQRLTDMLVRVEDYYNRPIDIEWAFSDGRLYLLQARPITAYIPLPEEMITEPGVQKYLYYDHTLLDIHDALSVLGTDFFRVENIEFTRCLMGTENVFGAKDGIFITLEGRGYANISNMIKLMGKKRSIELWGMQDAIFSDVLKNSDLSEYIPKKLPKRLRGVMVKTLLSNIGLIVNMAKASINPKRYHETFILEKDQLMEYLEGIEKDKNENILVKDFLLGLVSKLAPFITLRAMPLSIAAEMSRSRIKKIFEKEDPEIREKVAFLERSLPHNVTIEMGLDLFKLSCFEEIARCESEDEFLQKLEDKDFSDGFLKAWDHYIETYGFRCPKELDVATPRYSEEPEKIFEQLRGMINTKGTNADPKAIFEDGMRGREEAFNYLYMVAGKMSKRKQKKLKKNYDTLVLFSGYRELPKYMIIKMTSLFRDRVLEIAESFVESDRLDHSEEIFNLTIDTIDLATTDSSIDLRAIADDNTQFYNKIKNIRHFPQFIDSRGKIIRPEKRESKVGEIIGEPISPGIVRGKVKVLNSPDEKPVLPGEILVARTTDPGWTPLFLNAGGIILEVGGILQHGAVVAREYAKPCISGIIDATTEFKDGQEIEMDGGIGVIKILDAHLEEKDKEVK
ncbi:MAG: PEP-utilizing enzyme, partial [Halobacteriota archaeon]|nr:PEP-utilizing enzyme [Halobacteriota archaeon]